MSTSGFDDPLKLRLGGTGVGGIRGYESDFDNVLDTALRSYFSSLLCIERRTIVSMRPKTGLPSELGPAGQPILAEAPDIVPLQRDWMTKAVIGLAVLLLAIAAFGVWLRFRPIPYSPERWVTASGLDRGRMLSSLLEKADFVGFSRTDVEHYLGPANFDERQFWYDLGPADPSAVVEPRANVGEVDRLHAVFSFERDGSISQILYSRRRPLLGSAAFDSTGWFGEDRSKRREMFTRTLGELRARSLDRITIESLLGPADGSRIRAHYDVGLAGSFIGTHKALVLEYNDLDVVLSSHITD